MDYFENIVKTIIERENYWVRQGVKVNLSKEQKANIGKPTIPRPEIDIVGYNAQRNELLIIEVKSYLDSQGVKYADVIKSYDIPKGRYKLFTCEKYRKIVLGGVIKMYEAVGLITSEPSVVFGLAAGKIHSNDEDKLIEFFEKKKWKIYTPSNIAQSLEKFANGLYENNPYVITSKVLLRNLTK